MKTSMIMLIITTSKGCVNYFVIVDFIPQALQINIVNKTKAI